MPFHNQQARIAEYKTANKRAGKFREKGRPGSSILTHVINFQNAKSILGRGSIHEPEGGSLRQSNILKLEWSQINLEQRHAWIHAAQSKNRRPIAIPLNDAAYAVLIRQKCKHLERVFTFRGRPLNSANTRARKKALKRAGIDNFRWHDLRHTWATWQRQAGTPTHELQRLGGW